MVSLHMQNSDDYRGGKFETSASVKEWTIFLGGRVRVTFAFEWQSSIKVYAYDHQMYVSNEKMEEVERTLTRP